MFTNQPSFSLRPSPSPSFILHPSTPLRTEHTLSYNNDRKTRHSSSLIPCKDQQRKRVVSSPYKGLIVFAPIRKPYISPKRANPKSRVDEFLNSDANKDHISKTIQMIYDTGIDIEVSGSTTHEDAKKLLLLKTTYLNQDPTVFCTYPEICGMERNTARAYSICSNKLKLKYKFGHASKYHCIIKALETAGFEETEENDWNIFWGAPLRADTIKKLAKYQKCNHFPTAFQLGRKDHLWENISK